MKCELYNFSDAAYKLMLLYLHLKLPLHSLKMNNSTYAKMQNFFFFT